MNIPIFSNTYNITDYKYKEMMYKWERVKTMTNDNKLLEMTEYIIARDYYDLALEWHDKFKNAVWWREDLI